MNRQLLVVFGLFLVFTLPAQHHAYVASDSSLQDFFRANTLISAHRGGPTPDRFPENCLETFENILNAIPAVIEFDVEMSADSVLFLMHDHTLDRTTTGSGSVKTKNWNDISGLYLKTKNGTVTNFAPPSLEQTFSWIKQHEAVVTVDVKRFVPYERVVRMLEKHQLLRQAVIITYQASDALLVHQLNPNILISANIRNQEELDRHLSLGIPANRLVAFTGTREPDYALYASLKALGIPAILGTLGNLDQMAAANHDQPYKTFVQRGAQILATDRPMEAYRALWEN
jgi:glycerophosphoryl diester phosphodiesterase